MLERPVLHRRHAPQNLAPTVLVALLHLGLHDTKSPGILRAIGKSRLGGPS